MSSLTNDLNLDNEMSNLLTEAISYVYDRARLGSPAHEVEKGVFEWMLKLGRQLFSTFFKAQGDGAIGDYLELPTGKMVKRLPDRTRNYHSLFGNFTLTRAVYGSRIGQAAICIPLDTRLQLPQEEYSYPLQEMTQHLTTEVSYATAQTVLNKFLKLNITVDSMERINQQAGEMMPAFREIQSVPEADTEAKLLVLTADGKGVPIRHAKDAARIADQQLTSGPKPDRKRMAVVGAAYTIDPYPRTPSDIIDALFSEPNQEMDKKKPKRPSPKNKRVVAHLTRTVDGVEFKATESTFEWLANQIKDRGKTNQNEHTEKTLFPEIKPIKGKKIYLAMMDGQESLWNQVKLLKNVHSDGHWVEILDLMHVNSYLWDAACAFYPCDKKQQLVFMRERVMRVLEGKTEGVITELQQMAAKKHLNKSLQKVVFTVCRYFTNNQHRMKYNEYLVAGYPIATGVIEGACRHFVKDRMERAGMRWSIDGAQAMLNLRSANLNGDLDEFSQYRIQKQAEKLYKYRDVVAAIEWPIAA
jgi:hypothetical protein